MIKNVIFLTYFLTFSYLYAQSPKNSDLYWSKLLHFKENKNYITSSEFFLSNLNNPSPKEEKAQMIKLLNGKDGKIIACNYPARYKFLKENNFNIPSYNLKECTNLQQYIKEFKKEKIYLVFTSEFINSPSSAFGHIMVVFKNKNEPFETADTIHFAGKTEDDNFFTYAYKGLTGGYEGYFLRESFFKKIYEYNTLEQRYMYLYELDFTKEEIEKLVLHLYELRKATFKYYFLTENCATKIIDFLSIAKPNLKSVENPAFTLPIDTVKTYEKFLKNQEKFIPLIVKLNYFTKKMNKEEKKEFLEIIKTNKTPQKKLTNLTKESLIDYYTFLFRMYGKSYKNYDDIMSLKYQKNKVIDTNANPLNKTQASQISISSLYKNSKNFLKFEYRPLFISLDNIQNNNLQQTETSIAKSAFFANKDSFKLNSFELISMKSITKQSSYYMPPSWSIYSAIDRNNKEDRLLFNNYFALGLTKSFWDMNFINFNLGVGFETNIDDWQAYLKPTINIIHYFNKDLKAGLKLEHKQYLKKEYYNRAIYANYKINKRYNFLVKYNNLDKEKKDQLEFAIRYNF